MDIHILAPKAGEDYPTDWNEFLTWFGSEESCLTYLERLRWPAGFVCPACSCVGQPYRSSRGRMVCRDCGHQGTVTAGTIFDKTRTVSVANRDIAIQRLLISQVLTNRILFGVGRIGLIWIAATQVLDENFSAGAMVAFIAYADQFTGRASAFVDKIMDFRMLKLHTQRVADIALAEPEDAEDRNWEGIIPSSSIEFKNVSFRYADGEPWVLRNCSFLIRDGESVAIVGPSGCGKSTLAKIALGLVQPTEGSVLFGGIDIRLLGTSTYRQCVGAVMQNDQLFAGSIADNISFFDPEFSLDRVTAAAQLAAVHDDIMAMPMNYQTHVGDMGSSLSGGQKQRVILARALYRDPNFLLLDEATSHLDVARERQVNAAIASLNMTRVVIAHRPETIYSAERVLEMSEGRVVTEIAPVQSIKSQGI